MRIFEQTAVTVPASGLTTLATIYPGENETQLCFHFNVATQNLDDFDIVARSHPSASLQDFTPGTWSPLPSNGRLIEVSADLTSVAATGNGFMAMDVTGLFEVQIKVSAASDSASVTARWSLD